MTDLASELRTLVQRYGTHVLDDADGLRATLDDFLDEDSNPGDVNLLVDAVRFGSLVRLKGLLDQGAEPSAAMVDVAEALALRRGGDAESAYWACAVLGYAAGLLPGDLVPGNREQPPSLFPPSHPAVGASFTPQTGAGAESTNAAGQVESAHFDDANVTRQPGDGTPVPPGHPSGGAGIPPDPGPVQIAPATSGDSGRPKRRLTWQAASVATVITLLAAAVVYLVVTRDSSDSTAAPTGNDVPLAELDNEVPFGHFGDDLSKVLSVCRDASDPAAKDWKCEFADPNSSFRLELTEQDAKEANNGKFPDFVESPPPGTIVTTQNGLTRQHAYYMQRDPTGTGDTVNLTLYDVDPAHPGKAVFSSADSANAPLTREKADELLQSIAPNKEKFPLPAAFQREELKGFAAPFTGKHGTDICAREFTEFPGELEHVDCQDGKFDIEFGTIDSLARPHHRYMPSEAARYSWQRGNVRGTAAISHPGANSTRLYWTDDASSWGVLTANTRDPAELVKYFEGFQGTLTPSA